MVSGTGRNVPRKTDGRYLCLSSHPSGPGPKEYNVRMLKMFKLWSVLKVASFKNIPEGLEVPGPQLLQEPYSGSHSLERDGE